MKISTKPISPAWLIMRVLLIAAALICVHCFAGTDETFFYQGF
jgi:hypothetical protein